MKNIRFNTPKINHQKHQLHRVCIPYNTPPYFDQRRSKTSKNNSTTLFPLINRNYYVYYSILTFINMFCGLSGFILHLFISITNLLFIYSLLFIFLLVYIIYYLSLFLEEKNKPIKNRENLHFDLENLYILKTIRRYCYDD